MTDDETFTSHVIDAKGLKCPMPVLKLRKGLDRTGPGETVLLLATDQGSRKDVPAFCRISGDILVSAEEVDGIFRYVVRKRA